MRTTNFYKILFLYITTLLCTMVVNAQPANTNASSLPSVTNQDLIKAALKKSRNSISFIENLGQWPSEVKYYGSSATGNLIVKNNEIKFCSVEPETNEEESTSGHQEAHNWGISFQNSSPNCKVISTGVLPTSYNYFIGNNASTHASGVKSFGEVIMKDLYPGIDLRLYSQGEFQLEFDWIIHPGADYSQIKMSFTGQDKLSIDQNGKLVVKLRFDDVHFGIPESYQLVEGVKKSIKLDFNLSAEKNIVTFQTNETIDKKYTLVIDPDLKWGTYFDNNTTTFDDYVYAVDIDNAGNVFVGGTTNQAMVSTYIATSTFGYDNSYNGGKDGIVYKISANGTSILAVTYFGSTGTDQVFGLSLSPSKTNVFICGLTQGSIPMSASPTPFDNALGGTTDGYVACFPASTLGSLSYSSYIGSRGGTATGNNGSVPDDGVLTIRALSDNSYIIGANTAEALATASPNYITSAADNSYAGDVDMYIAKFTSFNTLAYGTYVGGNSDERLNDIEVFSDGSVAFVGTTSSSIASFTTAVAAAGSNPGTGNQNGVVGVLTPAGSAFTQLSRIGGTGADDFNGAFIGS